MKKIISKIPLLIIVLCNFNFCCLAQNVSGYQGKRAFIEYNLQPSFAIISGGPSIIVHDFQFSYITSRNKQVGLSLSRYSPKEITSETDALVDFSLIGIGLNMDFYYNNSLAPVGIFWRAEAKYYFGDSSLGDKVHFPLIGIGMGVRRIFFNKMVFNVGGFAGYAFQKERNGDPSIRPSEDIPGFQNLRNTLWYRFDIGVGLLLF